MKRYTLSRLFTILLTVTIIVSFTLSVACAQTRYVTLKTGAGGTDGAMEVYKDIYSGQIFTVNGYKSAMGKHTYATYLGSSGDYYKISWGDATGYVKKTEAVIVDTKPITTQALTSNKKLTYGIYTKYIAKGTYVIYSGTTKIKWGPYCNGNCTNEIIWVPEGYVNISSL